MVIDQKATLIVGAGCFWGVEDAFRKVTGVTSTAVGYMGGNVPNPTYEDVCTDTTGHAEVVQVEYDPAVVSYDELLETFWRAHDPTQLNRQGWDVGRQYRSTIFVHTPEQEAAATRSKAALQERSHKDVVTEIEPAAEFWRAEEYHQCYYDKHRKGGLVSKVFG